MSFTAFELISIPKSKIEDLQYFDKSPDYDSKFIAEAMNSLFTFDEMKGKSATGKKSNKKKKNDADEELPVTPSIDPIKKSLLTGKYIIQQYIMESKLLKS